GCRPSRGLGLWGTARGPGVDTPGFTMPPLRGSGQVPGRFSSQVAVDLGQQSGEVELARARLAGGVEIGAWPVALGFGQLGVAGAGLAAVAVVLVVGEEAGQVAEAGAGAGGGGAAAVAVGAERAAVGEAGVPQGAEVGLLHRAGEGAGGLGVL